MSARGRMAGKLSVLSPGLRRAGPAPRRERGARARLTALRRTGALRRAVPLGEDRLGCAAAGWHGTDRAGTPGGGTGRSGIRRRLDRPREGAPLGLTGV